MHVLVLCITSVLRLQ